MYIRTQNMAVSNAEESHTYIGSMQLFTYSMYKCMQTCNRTSVKWLAWRRELNLTSAFAFLALSNFYFQKHFEKIENIKILLLEIFITTIILLCLNGIAVNSPTKHYATLVSGSKLNIIIDIHMEAKNKCVIIHSYNGTYYISSL